MRTLGGAERATVVATITAANGLALALALGTK